MSTQPKTKLAPAEWQPSDAAELYRIPSWGDPFFFVNEKGHMAVRALDEQGTTMDVVDVVNELRRRGVQFPVLLRFQDVLRAQVRRVNEAFRSAIAESNYGNVYRGIYPIKVNQLHEVVDELLDAGRPYGMGLECGSKAELIACLPHIDGETLLVCNGVKDRTMLSLMIAGQKLGQNIVPVMEKYSEFTDVKGLAFSTGYMSQLGVRVRLATRGAGRWAESSGTNSKFGLNVAELMRMVNELEASGQQSKLVLLHCHIGSQIADIQVLKEATKEVTQIYAQLVKRGIALKYLDMGGGLGVNYDKGHLEEDAGINYALEEYANAVVFTVKEVCDANEVPTPTLVTESGRALTAHHSVLIVPVLGAHAKDDPTQDLTVPENAAEPLHALNKILAALPKTRKQAELLEALHDVNEKLEEVRQLFTLGYLPLERAGARREPLLANLHRLLKALKRNPETSRPEIVELEDKLTELYLCDFSVFQSMLDHWAIGQPFPIVPIDRLDERAREARDPRGSHLRFGRQGHALRVHARQPVSAGASDRARHAVLPGLLPDGRLRGHHRRRAQSVRARNRGARLCRRRGAGRFLDREDHPRHGRAGHARAGAVLPERSAPPHERARAREDPAERRAPDAGHGDPRSVHGVLPANDLLR